MLIIILQIEKPLSLLDGTRANDLSLTDAAAEEGDDGREGDCEDVFDLDLDWEGCLDLRLGERSMRKGGL
jgi:hypothetical protein